MKFGICQAVKCGITHYVSRPWVLWRRWQDVMPTPLAHPRDLAVIMRNPHHRHPHHRMEGQRAPVVITSNPVRPLRERFRKRV
jgi:hypothetical protein